MASSFSWLAYSEAERRRALDVVDSFKNRDTRDELGIGTVRDAFANIFFPGTTTIQTRARYFLFVPWTYLGLEQRARRRAFESREQLTKWARDEETLLIETLKMSDDPGGTIGIEAGRNLKRLPSNIYWYGLGLWGIRPFQGSQEDYHRMLLRLGPPTLQKREEEENPNRVALNWHSGLPPRPDDFPNNVSFKLTHDESDYLKERIKGRFPSSFLAFLVDRGTFWESVPYAWLHPTSIDKQLPTEISWALFHARNFSELMHGAALLYNLMLAWQYNQKFSCWEDKVDFYQKEVREWAERVTARRGIYATWDIVQFWRTVRSEGGGIPLPTEKFINTWLNIVFAKADPATISDDPTAQALIRDRERYLKKGLARLCNENALRQWSGAAGASQLDFRWGVSQRILTDIFTVQEDSRA